MIHTVLHAWRVLFNRRALDVYDARRMRRLIARAKGRAKLAIRPLVQRYRIRPAVLNPQRWGLVEGPGQGLLLQGLALDDLADKWGSPLHLVDALALRSNASRFLAPHGTPSGCEVFYSYKTNPVPAVLRMLHAQGIGAEVISHYELWLAQQLGVPPSKIVFNGPGKSTASIREAISIDVQIININHAEEIARVANVARALGRRPRVGLRVTTGDGWAGQFGTPIQGGAALKAFADAESTGVLEVVGLHAHLGGMIRSREALLGAVAGVLDFVGQLEKQQGRSLEILNFGGSLATPTVAGLSELDRRLNRTFHRDLPEPLAEESLAIEDYVTSLFSAVREWYARRSKVPPRIFVEPGRSLTGNTQMLVATVLSTKQVADAHYLILDAGINIAESVRNEYHKIFPTRGWRDSATDTYTLVGPICSPADTLLYAWRSRKMREGDRLVIMDAGAYFVPFSTSFAYPQPAIVMLDGGQDTLIRQAERFEDLVSFDA